MTISDQKEATRWRQILTRKFGSQWLRMEFKFDTIIPLLTPINANLSSDPQHDISKQILLDINYNTQFYCPDAIKDYHDYIFEVSFILLCCLQGNLKVITYFMYDGLYHLVNIIDRRE